MAIPKGSKGTKVNSSLIFVGAGNVVDNWPDTLRCMEFDEQMRDNGFWDHDESLEVPHPRTFSMQIYGPQESIKSDCPHCKGAEGGCLECSSGTYQ